MESSVNKTRRLSIRASSQEKELLAQAADLTRTTISQFVLREALDAAEQLLMDRTRFSLDDEAWQEFADRLDRPPRELPEIRRLMRKPSPFDE